MERKQQNDPTAKFSRRHVVQVGTSLVAAPMLMDGVEAFGGKDWQWTWSLIW